MMDQLNLNAWQMIAAGVLYIAYLCWVMFGGMRKKKIKPVVYIVMTILMFYGLLKEYDGIHSVVEIIDICLILLIGFVKGIYLGKRKIVEYIDDRWYMHHDKKYILVWVLFFAVKLSITQILKLVTGSAMPFWHMILYFCFYYADLVENSVARIGTAEQNIESLQKQIDVLKNRSEPIILFRSGQNAMGVYAPEIGVILNNGYHLMTDFVEEHPHFCSAENDYTISYSQGDFGWDAQILTVCTKTVSLTEESEIMISYLSGVTEDGSLYLVPKPEKIDVPVTIYVNNQITANDAISLNFKWLQSEGFITTVTECSGIADGEYYLAWIGRSNNSHPMIKRIQVLN